MGLKVLIVIGRVEGFFSKTGMPCTYTKRLSRLPYENFVELETHTVIANMRWFQQKRVAVLVLQVPVYVQVSRLVVLLKFGVRIYVAPFTSTGSPTIVRMALLLAIVNEAIKSDVFIICVWVIPILSQVSQRLVFKLTVMQLSMARLTGTAASTISENLDRFV